MYLSVELRQDLEKVMQEPLRPAFGVKDGKQLFHKDYLIHPPEVKASAKQVRSVEHHRKPFDLLRAQALILLGRLQADVAPAVAVPSVVKAATRVA